jgi:exonuclease VII small subunit
VDIESIVLELEAERDRLNEAIAALRGRKHTAGKAEKSLNGRSRRFSAATRKRMSQRMKQRWAARKKAGKKRL